MNDTPLPFQPIFIIGAGRSGTNILRDALCNLPEVATWPCDEINPIMRHGNIFHPHDRFGDEEARQDVRAFVRNAFLREWRRQDRPAFLVEKTCANSLRVPFLNAIFPEARFIAIHRHGGDVLASARKRWRGEMELPSLPYYWSKIRFTPLRDLPIYGWRFARARWDMMRGKTEHMASWGPLSPAMLDLPKDATLDEICARQWADCVTFAMDDLAALDAGDAERIYKISYENFVAKPKEAITSLAEFMDHTVSEQECAAAGQSVRASSVGKGTQALALAKANVSATIQPVLDRLGY